MLLSSIPAKFKEIWANAAATANIRAVPQTSADANAASQHLGFPPNTFAAVAAGGSPPDGRDFNGAFNALWAWAQWVQAGGSVVFDSAFSTAVGGYPKGAVLLSSTSSGLMFRSLTDNNTGNPDSSTTNWAIIDSIVAQNLADNNGWHAYATGFKEAWGFNNTIANGATDTITFSSFMGANAFTTFQRAVITSNQSGVLLASTTATAITIHNGSGVTASYQWSTRGV